MRVSIPTVRRRMRSASLLLVGPLVVLVSAGAVWAVTLPALVPVVLPRDHGAHPGFQVEWWYTAGTVAASRGDDYFWFATVWASSGALVARVNVVDLQLRSRRALAGVHEVCGSRRAIRPGSTSAASTWAGSRTGAWGRWSVDAPVGAARAAAVGPDPGPAVRPQRLEAGSLPRETGPVRPTTPIPGWPPRGRSSSTVDPPASAARAGSTTSGATSPSNPSSMHWNWFACQFANRSDLMLYQFITPAGSRPGSSRQASSQLGRNGHPSACGSRSRPSRPTIRPPGATGTYPLDGTSGALGTRGRHARARGRATSSSPTSSSRASGREPRRSRRGASGRLHRRVHSRDHQQLLVRGLLTPGDRSDQLVIDRVPAGRQAVLEARAADQPQPT